LVQTGQFVAVVLGEDGAHTEVHSAHLVAKFLRSGVLIALRICGLPGLHLGYRLVIRHGNGHHRVLLCWRRSKIYVGLREFVPDAGWFAKACVGFRTRHEGLLCLGGVLAVLPEINRVGRLFENRCLLNFAIVPLRLSDQVVRHALRRDSLLNCEAVSQRKVAFLQFLLCSLPLRKVANQCFYRGRLVHDG